MPDQPKNNANCNKKDCVQVYLDCRHLEENENLLHCEVKGCHNIYWESKNGASCEDCGSEICEYHIGTEAPDDLFFWVCPICYEPNEFE